MASMRYGWGMSKDEQHPTENPTGPGDTPPTAKEGAWSDVELVERAERLGDSFRTVGGIPSDPCPTGCISCRGAALWQTLDGLRGLRLVSPRVRWERGPAAAPAITIDATDDRHRAALSTPGPTLAEIRRAAQVQVLRDAVDTACDAVLAAVPCCNGTAAVHAVRRSLEKRADDLEAGRE